MLRCPEPAEGTYEVTFKHLHGEFGDDADRPKGWVDYNADIGEHGDTFKTFANGNLERDEAGQPIVLEPGPRVSEAVPYVGELCEHELAWLRTIPGRVFNRNRRYTVRREGE